MYSSFKLLKANIRVVFHYVGLPTAVVTWAGNEKFAKLRAHISLKTLESCPTSKIITGTNHFIN